MRQKTQNQFLKFSIHLSVRKSREKNYSQIYGTYKASLWRNLSTGKPPKISLAQSFVLQLQFTSHNLFRTVVLRKLFDIRFSNKHCNFSHVCLLVKMASKTVTRSIRPRVYDKDGLDTFFFFKRLLSAVQKQMSGKVDLAISIYFCGFSSLEKTPRILRHSENILLSYTINSVLLYAIALGGVLETN